MDLNKPRTGVDAKFYDLTTKIVAEQGYDLYDCEYIAGSSTLRVFIMDKATKTAVIEDCVKVDRAFSPFCEDEEGYGWIPDDFVLEVSSPGVYRVIKTSEHFESALNEVISVVITGNLNEEINNDLPKAIAKSKKFRGVLESFNSDLIELNIDGAIVKIAIESIKKANLDPDFNG